MSAHLFPFREGEVIASAAMEAKPSAAFLESAALLAPYARRHADADDVASLARLLLPSIMDSGLTGSLAAGAAVKRASQRLGEVNAETRAAEIPAGDTREDVDAGAETLARPFFPAPDACARVTAHDVVTTAIAAADVDADGAALLSLLRRHADAWGGGHGADAGAPHGPVLAALLAGAAVKRGRRTAAVADAARAALAALDSGDLPAWLQAAPLNGADAAKHERGTVRDSRQATSGPASLMVRTLASGERWVTLADRSIRVTADGAAETLARADALPAWHGGTAREVLAADLSSPRDLLPARRPCGVGVGMVHGSGQRAGGGAPDARPAAPRKRRRDGGIGASMTRA